jgi:hypothetical protein
MSDILCQRLNKLASMQISEVTLYMIGLFIYYEGLLYRLNDPAAVQYIFITFHRNA